MDAANSAHFLQHAASPAPATLFVLKGGAQRQREAHGMRKHGWHASSTEVVAAVRSSFLRVGTQLSRLTTVTDTGDVCQHNHHMQCAAHNEHGSCDMPRSYTHDNQRAVQHIAQPHRAACRAMLPNDHSTTHSDKHRRPGHGTWLRTRPHGLPDTRRTRACTAS